MNKGMFYLLLLLVFTPVSASSTPILLVTTGLIGAIEHINVRSKESPKAIVTVAKPISGRNRGRQVIKVMKPRAGRNKAKPHRGSRVFIKR